MGFPRFLRVLSSLRRGALSKVKADVPTDFPSVFASFWKVFMFRGFLEFLVDSWDSLHARVSGGQKWHVLPPLKVVTRAYVRRAKTVHEFQVVKSLYAAAADGSCWTTRASCSLPPALFSFAKFVRQARPFHLGITQLVQSSHLAHILLLALHDRRQLRPRR